MQEYRVRLAVVPGLVQGEQEADLLHTALERHGFFNTTLVEYDTENEIFAFVGWIESYNPAAAASLAYNALTMAFGRVSIAVPAVFVTSYEAALADTDSDEDESEDPIADLVESVIAVEPIRSLVASEDGRTIPERVEQIENWIDWWVVEVFPTLARFRMSQTRISDLTN